MGGLTSPSEAEIATANTLKTGEFVTPVRESDRVVVVFKLKFSYFYNSRSERWPWWRTGITGRYTESTN